MAAKHESRITALGGTFEQLHKGHRKFIFRALQVSDKVIIGLSSDGFLAGRRKKHDFSSYKDRLASLKSFLSKIVALDRVTIVPLEDPYGPTIVNEEISAIVVSPETLNTAIEINRIRTNNGMNQLRIYVVDFVLAEDGKPVSSSRISQGVINKEGKLLRG